MQKVTVRFWLHYWYESMSRWMRQDHRADCKIMRFDWKFASVDFHGQCRTLALDAMLMIVRKPWKSPKILIITLSNWGFQWKFVTAYSELRRFIFCAPCNDDDVHILLKKQFFLILTAELSTWLLRMIGKTNGLPFCPPIVIVALSRNWRKCAKINYVNGHKIILKKWIHILAFPEFRK